jgi:hypothetical protein
LALAEFWRKAKNAADIAAFQQERTPYMRDLKIDELPQVYGAGNFSRPSSCKGGRGSTHKKSTHKKSTHKKSSCKRSTKRHSHKHS